MADNTGIAPDTTAAPSDTSGLGDAVDSVIARRQDNTASQIRNNAMTATTVNPDQEAQFSHLAKFMNVPVDSVRAQPDAVKQQAAAQQIDASDIARNSPATGRVLSDQNSSKLAMDDVANMRDLESTMNIDAPKPSLMGSLGDKYSLSAARTYQGIKAQVGDMLGNQDIVGDANRQTGIANMVDSEVTPTFDSALGRWTYGAASGMVGSAPALLASALNPLAGVAMFGAQAEAEGYGKYRERGATAGQALEGGTLEGGITAATSFLPLKFLSDKLGKVGAGQFLTGFLARDLPTMTAQSLATSAVDESIANPNGSVKDYLSQLPENLGQAATSALMFAGTFSAIHMGAHLKAQAAEKNAQSVQQMSDLASASKLRARDPDAFNTFMADANQNNQVQDLYVDPKALAQAGIDPAGLLAVPGTAEQLGTALASGGDVKIPVADFATHLAGTDYGQSLIDHIRTDPTAMSNAEAQEFMQSHGAKLQGEVDKVLANTTQSDPFKESMQRVNDDVLRKLTEANRFTDDVNKPYASLLSNFYGVQAARLGITPEEMYTQHPIDVKAPMGSGDPDEFNTDQKLVMLPEGTELSQSKLDSPEFKKWFGNSKVVDDNGKPQAVYHGTTHEIKEFNTSGSGKTTHSGAFFSSNPDVAATYAVGRGEGENVTPVHLSLQNPVEVHAYGKNWNQLDHEARIVIPDRINDGVADAKLLSELHGKEVEPVATKDMGYDTDAGDIFNMHEGETTSTDDLARWAKREGFDGIIFRNIVDRGPSGKYATEGANKPSDMFVAFHPEQIKSVHNVGEFDPNNPDILHQAQYIGGVRGAFNPETSTIKLFSSADLSTFLHESGHFFLETMNKLALQENAPKDIRDDMQATLKWLGVKDLAEWNAHDIEWQREKHEQFARGFEAYLFEGKSPSIEMQGIFSRFRAWLLNVYGSVKALNVNLSPDIRNVFDRMLATNDQIKNAEFAQHFEPLFKTPEEGSMTPEEFRAYHDLGVQATQDAVDNLQERSLRDMQWLSNARNRTLKEFQKNVSAKRAAVRREVTDEVMSEPVNKARTFFKRGEINGEKLEDVPHRLDVDAVSKMEHIPIDHLESKYGKYGILGKDGLHPDEAAEMFGFDSGTDLLESLIHAENPKEKIAGLTDQRMLERYGDLTNPGVLDNAVNAAVHNETRAKFIATEANALHKAMGGRKILAAAARGFAGQMVGRMKVRNLKPSQFSAAEARAARNAEAARAKGDIPAAAGEKRNQLIQNYAARAAHEALDDIEKGVNYLNRFNRKATRESVGRDYMAQIDALLDRFDLNKNTTLKELARRESLRQWYESQLDKGYDPAIPDNLLDESQKMSYKDMSVESFKGLIDSVKSIEHLGRLKQKLLDRKDARDFDAIVNEAVEAMGKLPQKDTPEARNPGTGGKGLDKVNAKFLNGAGLLKSADASLLKMEQTMTWLDGNNPHGVFNRVVFSRIADAQGHEHELQIPITAKLRELAEKMPAESKADFLNRYTVPELRDSRTGKASSLLKSEILSIALNTGNESNFSKLLQGEKWQAKDVKTVLDRHMTKGDWDFVQGVWDGINSLWPHIEAMEKRLSGVAPPKIESTPVETPHGTYRGGYYPVVYDPLRSHDVDTRNDRSGDKLFENSYTRATTPKGHTIERVENYARPLYLSLDVLPRHLSGVIHDLAYREAVIDADRFLSDARVRRSIESTLGREYYKQFRPWLQAIANDKVYDSRGLAFWDKAAHWARTSATIVGLGYRIPTMLIHGTTALSNSIGEIGPKWMGSGAKAFFGSPEKMSQARDFVFERSLEMKNRMNETDRDIRDALREMEVHGSEGPLSKAAQGLDAVKRFAFYGIAALDMGSAMPTWLGAYNRALHEGRTENEAIYEGDKAVRNAHGGGGVKDSAAIQRGTEFQKLFTMFYSFWNHFYNRQRDIARTAASLPQTLRQGDTTKAARDFSMVLSRSLFYFIIPQLLHAALKPSTNPDDGDDKNWAAWAAEEIGAGMFAGIPVARDLVNSALTGRDYNATPAAQIVTSMGKSAKDIAGTIHGTGATDKWVKNSIQNTGYVFGLPTGQAASTTQFLWDVMDGDQSPSDMSDWYNGILHGRASGQ